MKMSEKKYVSLGKEIQKTQIINANSNLGSEFNSWGG